MIGQDGQYEAGWKRPAFFVSGVWGRAVMHRPKKRPPVGSGGFEYRVEAILERKRLLFAGAAQACGQLTIDIDQRQELGLAGFHVQFACLVHDE